MRSTETPSNYWWLTPSLSSENELRGRSQTVGSMIRGRRDSSTFRGGGDKKDLGPPVQTFSALFKILLWPLRLYHGLDHPAGNAWQNTAFCRWPGRFQYNNSRSSSNVTHEVFLVFSDSLCCQLTFFATDWQWVLSARDKNGRWVKKAVKLPTTKVKKAVKSTFAAFGNELWAAACLRLLNSLTPF